MQLSIIYENASFHLFNEVSWNIKYSKMLMHKDLQRFQAPIRHPDYSVLVTWFYQYFIVSRWVRPAIWRGRY